MERGREESGGEGCNKEGRVGKDGEEEEERWKREGGGKQNVPFGKNGKTTCESQPPADHPPDSAQHSAHSTPLHSAATLSFSRHRTHTHQIPTRSPRREVIQESITWRTHTHSPPTLLETHHPPPFFFERARSHARRYMYMCTDLSETAGAIKPKPGRASFLQMDLRSGLYRIICQHAAGNETSHS